MQQRAEETRKKVLYAAAAAFDRAGFRATTMGDILGSAQVTKGALYFHFASKEQLAQAILGSLEFTWQPMVEKRLEEGGPSLAMLIDISRAWAEAIRSEVLVRAAIRLSLEHAVFTEPMPELYDGWVATVDKLLRGAVADGDVRPDVDAEATARFIVSAFTGVQITSRVYTGYSDFEQRIDDMWMLLLPGLTRGEMDYAKGAPVGAVREASAPAGE